MTQTAVRNLDGMATSFHNTQLINIRATTENQLIQVFRSLLPHAVYENKPLALVQTKLSTEHKQINILKALMVSPAYWDTLIAAAPLSVVKQISIYALTSDFLLNGDRFNRLLSRLSPRQDRYDKTYSIALVGIVGQVDLGFPFVATTLDVVGAVPTLTFPSTGLLQFAAGDVGTLVQVSFVTAPVYSVVKIVRTHDQIPDHNGVVHPPYAYVLHPLLATLLGITIPPI
jgi:hypothetical protein